MVNIHSVIKFWARKPPSFLDELIPSNVKSIMDPFCGSGTTGYVGVLKGIKRIVLSDVNPVAVFISYNTLNKAMLGSDVLAKAVETCRDIENDAYAFTYNGERYVIEKAAWVTKYTCPYCNSIVDPRVSRENRSGVLKCNNCGRVFFPVEARGSFDEVFEVQAYDRDGRKITIRDPRVLKVYEEESSKLKPIAWFPEGEFTYPSGKPFNQHPHRIKRVSELFTKRGLYASSLLYQFIEDYWLHDSQQGDLLKLAFISSIVAATKMMPYATTSGTSWKLPRYWIPSVRYEKNFCRTFIRKLNILSKFKNEWSRHVEKYMVSASFDSDMILDNSEYSIDIIRADARELNVNERFDVIVMDPPHFSEINYFELTYLWQLWLKGRYSDRRFTDFSFWQREIDVNPRVARGLDDYIKMIAQVISKFTNMLSANGKLFMILHNSDALIISKTVEYVKESVRSIQYREVPVRIPSSAQGIHKKPKHKLYLIIAETTNTS